MKELIDIVAKALDPGAFLMTGGDSADARDDARIMAGAALEAIREAGYVVVPHDISNEACDAALRATGSWLDIKGSGLTIKREKMRRRWRNALTFYKNEMDSTPPMKAGDRAND